MTERKRHRWSKTCLCKHICPECKYGHLKKYQEPCKSCFKAAWSYCYFVPKEDTTDDRV